MGSINSLSSSYLQSILNSALLGAGSASGTSASGATSASALAQQDSNQLSPFAQLLNTLQQLQQTDPAKYQQLAGQIASNLQSAAKTAQTDGNTSAATELNQLATDFSSASQSGQLPSVQDLARAAGGGHGGHHHAHAASSQQSSSVNQLLEAFQSDTQDDSLNPASIITNTLASAGIDVSNT